MRSSGEESRSPSRSHRPGALSKITKLTMNQMKMGRFDASFRDSILRFLGSSLRSRISGGSRQHLLTSGRWGHSSIYEEFYQGKYLLREFDPNRAARMSVPSVLRVKTNAGSHLRSLGSSLSSLLSEEVPPSGVRPEQGSALARFVSPSAQDQRGLVFH
jgi:hypothetical protein